MLGRLLAWQVKQKGPQESCLSEEALGALIEKRLGKKLRRKALEHITECRQCYLVFSNALKTQRVIQDQQVSEKETASGISTFLFRPIVLAAAAVLLVLGGLILQRSLVQGPGSRLALTRTQNRVLILGKNGNWNNGSRHVWKEQRAFSFSGGRSVQSSAFHAGVHLVDMETSIKAGDSENALIAKDRMIDRIRPVKGSENLVDLALKTTASSEKMAQLELNTEEFFRNQGALPYLDFGLWVEAGRIAALSHNQDFFQMRDVLHFTEQPEIRKAPQGVALSLGKIRNILGQGKMSDREFENLEQILRDMILTI